MQITGQNHLSVDPATAWRAFHDAGVLERSLPGCQSLTEVGPGRYAMTVSAGVAAIKGTYDGEAAFSEEQEPESFLLSLSGAGGPGTVNADVRVQLSEAQDGGTTLDWTADAVVGGPVGGVGQRMLSSVAKRLAGQFFKNIDADLARGGQETGGSGDEGAGAAGSTSGAEGVAAGGAVDAATGGGSDTAGRGEGSGAAAPASGPQPRRLTGAAASPGPATDQLVPMLTGAAIALVGVALGARLRRH